MTTERGQQIFKVQRTNRQRSCAYYQSLTINSRYCRYFRQNIYCIDDTNGTAPSSVDSRKSRCKENSAQNDYINQRATRRFNGIANTVIILLCIVYQLVIIAFQQSHSFTRNTLNIKVCSIVMLMLAVTIFVYKHGSITRLLMTWCEYHYIHNTDNFINLSAASLNEKSLFLGDFNAHHKALCRAAQNRAGMNIN